MNSILLALGLLVYVFIEIRAQRRQPVPFLEAIRARSRSPLGFAVIVAVRAGREDGMMKGPTNKEEIRMSTPTRAMASGLVHNRTDDRVKRSLEAKGEQGVDAAGLAEELNLPAQVLDISLHRLQGAGEAQPLGNERWRARS